MEFGLVDILGILGFLFGSGWIGKLIFELIRNKAKTAKLEADAVYVFQQAATSAADDAIKWRERVVKLEETLDELKTQYLSEIATLRAELHKVMKENAAYRNWAERLTKQVIELDGTPEPFVKPE
jgi:hypothetical protein